MNDKIWDKFSKIFGGDFFDFSSINKVTDPEEFVQMGGDSEYKKTIEEGTDEYGNKFTKETYVSKDGRRTFTRRVSNMKFMAKKSDSKKSETTNSKYSNELYTLEAELKDMVAEQKFERASEIRDRISELKKKRG